MKWMRLMLPLVVLSGLVLPAQAQIFNRKPRLTMQVPELIVTAKTDPDERRRAAAVEQLRESDLRAYPDITGVLIEILLNDSGPKGTVKLEAVRSLSKVRPVSQLIGQAMQQAALNDDNWRVRLQAKTAMWMMGYHGDGKGALAADPKGMTMTEPPLANDPTVKAVPGPNAPLPLPMPPGTPAKGFGQMPISLPANPPIEITPDSSNRPLPPNLSFNTPRPLPNVPPPPIPLPVQGIPTKGPGPITPPTNPSIEIVPDSSNRQLPPNMAVSMPRPIPSRPAPFSTATLQQPSIQVIGPQNPIDLPLPPTPPVTGPQNPVDFPSPPAP